VFKHVLRQHVVTRTTPGRGEKDSIELLFTEQKIIKFIAVAQIQEITLEQVKVLILNQTINLRIVAHVCNLCWV
jgi:hypothetical protein